MQGAHPHRRIAALLIRPAFAPSTASSSAAALAGRARAAGVAASATSRRGRGRRQQGEEQRQQGPMPKGVKKENLPSKTCVVCERPFTWRKKWERCWDEVTTCRCGEARRRPRMWSRGARYGPGDAQVTDAPAPAPRHRSKKCNAIRRRQSRRQEDDGGTSVAEVDAGLFGGETDGRLEGQKDCTLCSRPVDLLVRCTVDASGKWEMVCGRCWRDVSGGVTDGDAAHPHYRYGGLWKNRRAPAAVRAG